LDHNRILYAAMNKYSFITGIFLLSLLFFTVSDVFAYDYGISTSRGDAVVVFGHETDPATETPESIYNMMQRWAGKGYNSVLWREISWLFGPVNHARMRLNPQARTLHLGSHWLMTDYAQAFDGIKEAIKQAKAAGLDLWVWKEIWNDGTPAGSDPPYWPYGIDFLIENPQYQVVSRDGVYQYGVMEFAYPQAREYKVDEVLELVTDHGVSKIMIVLRTEMALTMPAPETGDTMGFSPPVVDDMLSLYGVNILTDPRFDAKSAGFNIDDPMVENWRRLRGGYLTEFLRETRQALDAIDPDIELGIYCNNGNYLGPPFGNMRQQWQTWIDEGLVSRILMGAHMGSCVNGDCGTGYKPDDVSYAQVNNYIAASAHPEIKLIKAGAGYDPNTDGSMDNSDGADKSFADSQRDSQILDILSSQGYIGYIEQNFDEFPSYTYPRANGGIGDSHYFPSLNKSPGFWERFGDIDDGYAVIQDEFRYGDYGKAAKLIRGNGTVSARRSVSPGYSVDDPLQSGYAVFESRIYIQDVSGGMVVYLTNFNQPNVFEIGLYIRPNTGRLLYIDNGSWVNTDKYMAANQWHKVKFRLDMTAKKYSVYIGEDSETEVAADASWSETSYIDYLWFYPDGATGAVSYIDDVYLRWNPMMYPNDPQCGDLAHPYPSGDLNQDCRVDLRDIAILSDYWFDCTLPDCSN
jgi:hypothetical protein